MYAPYYRYFVLSCIKYFDETTNRRRNAALIIDWFIPDRPDTIIKISTQLVESDNVRSNALQ